MSIPDFPLGQTVDFKFTTRQFSDAVPTTLAGTPVVEIYEDNSLTQITASETLTVDFDGVTGLNNLRVVATSGNGFGTNQSYAAVLSAGTVGGTSVVGEVVAQFTIERSPALRPTTVGNTLDVTATGAAGIDWANVENPTTALDLSGTDIQLVDTTTTNTDMRGTDSAALASEVTAARMSELDDSAGKLVAVADLIQTAVDAIKLETDKLTLGDAGAGVSGSIIEEVENIIALLPAALVGGRIDATVDATGMESGAVDAIWAKAMVELAAEPGVTDSILEGLEWVILLALNKGLQTNSLKTLRNAADSADIATSGISDDGTTFTRNAWS